MIRYILFFTLISIYSVSKEDKIIYAFWDNHSSKYTKMIYVGETVSIDKVDMLNSNQKIDKDLVEIGVDLRMDTLTVRVLNNPGIRVGQTLYLIEKNPDHKSFKEGNIVGQIKVASIFDTSFFGKQIRGEGYLRLIENKVMAVAMPIESESIDEALVLKKQGDYFVEKADFANAITYYKKSIIKDPNSPESHFALAKIHTTTGEGYVSAGYEFSLAWKNRHRFEDIEEKFEFYKDYMKFLISNYEIESIKKRAAIENIYKCLEVGKEAGKTFPKDSEIHYTLAHANFLLFLKSKDAILATTEEEAKQKQESRQKREDYISESEMNLEKSLKLKPVEYKTQMLAVLIYFEKLSDLPNKQTSSEVTKTKELKSKIETHGKLYLTYKPKNKKVDRKIKDILEITKSFE